MLPQSAKKYQPAMFHAINSGAWALGKVTGRKGAGFHIRRVVWGLTMAAAELRDGEEVRACTVLIERRYKRRIMPKLPVPDPKIAQAVLDEVE